MNLFNGFVTIKNLHRLSQGSIQSPFEGGKGDEKNGNRAMNKNNFYYSKNLKELARRLRDESNKEEIKLWKDVLRGSKMHGYKFLRQRPVLNYIADFMCKELMLIIEVDGITHHYEEIWRSDVKKQKELGRAGFTVLRFADDDVLNDIRNVERSIEHWVLDHPPVGDPNGLYFGAPPSKGDKNSANR